MAEAQAILDALPELSGEAAAEAMLVRAALVRWRGDYTEAEAQVRAVLELPIPPLLENRARLWQGLVAKDAGRFEEALAHLGSVSHNTLLMAHARYQEGDLRGRPGDPERGAACIEEALELLQASVSGEERARIHARLGTVLRRSARRRRCGPL